MERRARRPEEATWQDLLNQGDDGSSPDSLEKSGTRFLSLFRLSKSTQGSTAGRGGLIGQQPKGHKTLFVKTLNLFSSKLESLSLKDGGVRTAAALHIHHIHDHSCSTGANRGEVFGPIGAFYSSNYNPEFTRCINICGLRQMLLSDEEDELHL
ncbi:hypothetical protein ABVT39_002009 [Epinephelus coioides]